jgi:translocation and assembly module TamA
LKSGSHVFAAFAFTAAALAAPVVKAAVARARIEGVSDADLRQHIEQAVGEVRSKPKDGLEARRRAEDAAEPAALALRSEGYYNYKIAPDVADGSSPQPLLRIDPGPRFKIADPGVEWVGEAPDNRTAAAALKALGLTPGEAGRAPEVVAAEGRVVAALKKRGYADAKAETRRVVADYATSTLTPTYRIEAGGIVKLDGVRVKTKGRTRPGWVSKLAPWTPGQQYRPEELAELERRLTDTGAFRGVEVSLAPPAHATPDGLRPVEVNLVDRNPVSVQLGASYSTNEGIGVDSAVRFYDRLGMADTVSLIATVAEIQQLFGVQLSLPHMGRPDQTLIVEPDVYGDETDAYDDAGQRIRVSLKRRLKRNSYLTFSLAVDDMREKEFAIGPGPEDTIQVTHDLVIVSGFAGVALDNSDNPLNPTRGWKFASDLTPTTVTGDKGLTFVRSVTQASTYLSLNQKAYTVLAARAKIGTALDATAPDMPAPLRFYSGGGGSVRGYAYQGIGPHFPNGAPEGGASVFETSFELRQHLFGKWGMAAFIDGGSIARTAAPDFTHVEWAAGLGARYMLGFGPLRADIAFPFDHRGGNPSAAVYLGLGQAF